MSVQKWIKGHAADRYDLTRNNTLIVKKRYKHVIKHLENKSVVDLGCAYGIGTKMISDAGFKVVGVDIDKEVIGKAKRLYPEIKFQVKNIAKLQMTGYENFVLCDVIQHLSNHEQILSKWESQLENAILVGTTLNPNLMSPDKMDEFSPGLITPTELRKLFPDVICWTNDQEVKHRYWFEVNRT